MSNTLKLSISYYFMVISPSLSTCVAIAVPQVPKNQRNLSWMRRGGCQIWWPCRRARPQLKNILSFTLLLAHYHTQDAKHARDILRLNVAVLLLIETVEDLSIFFDQLRTHLGLQLYHRFFLYLGWGALHYITANYYKCTSYMARRMVEVWEEPLWEVI